MPSSASVVAAIVASPLVASVTEWLNPVNLLHRMGSLALVGVILIIFAECGLLIGFFLPGDSLLFVTGMFVASDVIEVPIALVVVVLIVAAVLGNLVGYWVGRKIGPPLFHRPDSRLFRQEYVVKSHSFFEKYGSQAILLARFVPIVRTFITATAGIAEMSFRKYAMFSAIGGAVWAGGVTLLGFYLGTVPIVADHVELMLIVIVLLSVIPIAIEAHRHRRQAKVSVEA